MVGMTFNSTINKKTACNKRDDSAVSRETIIYKNMKVIYVISLIILLMSPFRLMGQYGCYDNEGVTNVRKDLGTQYEIVDKVGKYEVFYSLDWLYFYETPIDTLLTWIPFGRSVFDNIDKFIHGKNIKSLQDMPRIRSVRKNDTLISCRNEMNYIFSSV